ncbi:MAG: transaldolase family protein [Collinsella sp.]
MAIKVFADGANLEGMLDMHDNGNVQGFTTNPSLMKAGGVTDYRAFAKTVLEHITDVSVSLRFSLMTRRVWKPRLARSQPGQTTSTLRSRRSTPRASPLPRWSSAFLPTASR